MSLTMCESPLIFTDSPEKRCGGIVVAGLNWGVACDRPEDLKEVCTARWTPSAFYDIHDRFRCDMTRRFAVWGHDPRLDKEFDSALVAFNLFYNTTHGSGGLDSDAGDWDKAIRRLFTGAASIDASAVIINTRLAFEPLNRFLRGEGPAPRWSDAGGNWQTCKSGTLEIAISPHHTCRKRAGFSRSQVRAGLSVDTATRAAAPAMSAWFDRAMTRCLKMHG